MFDGMNLSRDKNLQMPLVLKPESRALVKRVDGSSLHTLSQMDIIKTLDQDKCTQNVYSKKSPDKLKQENITGTSPSVGNTLVDVYSNRTLSHKLHIYALSKKILLSGKKLGIWGGEDSPMLPQLLLHSTITSLILDKPNYQEYYSVVNDLTKKSKQITEVFNSKDLKELELVLYNWKMCPDGNLGIEFKCNPKQDVRLTSKEFLNVVKHDRASLDLEQKKRIMESLLSQPKVYDKKNYIINLTRLQWIRLNLALAGAQVKTFYPGTFMVVGWTKDADKLRNHQNLNEFMTRIDSLVKNQIGTSYRLDSVKEFAYIERTLNPDFTVDTGKTGKFTDNLSKSNLIIEHNK